MQNANFLVYEDYILINNVTEIKEFSDKLFTLKINNTFYKITGVDLILEEASTDNKTLKITGNIEVIEKKDKQTKKEKGFFKKLFA